MERTYRLIQGEQAACSHEKQATGLRKECVKLEQQIGQSRKDADEDAITGGVSTSPAVEELDAKDMTDDRSYQQ